MPGGTVNNGIAIIDITNLPLTASVNKMSQLTGISHEVLKKLAEDKEIVSIPIDGRKILLSTWSVVEKFNLVPADVLKEIWKEKVKEG